MGNGEEEYPGNLEVTVEYKLTKENELIINYYGKCDKSTVLNLTNHSYFNLKGHASGDVLDHRVRIYAKNITTADSESIPTGEIRNVEGTPMDFTNLKCIGADIDKEYDQLINGNGYDHNWIIDDYTGELKKAAEVIEDNSGRLLEVFTTKPGIQFYTGNFLNENEIGKGGVKYKKRQGLCLETQYFPDSLHHSGFSNIVLKPGQEYKHTTIYKDYTGELKKAAEVIEDNSGRLLEVFTTKPGIQFYTGNFLNENEIGKGGVKYKKRQGLCLETQYFPDSLHHSGFSNIVLKPGQEYKHTTIYKIGIVNK